jgi:phospholipid/cholesterol/gamma-HCH transport system ATP-binding protein
MTTPDPPSPPPVRVENLTMAYGEQIIQRNLTFSVRRGDIFIIMGGNGSGKSTLLKHLVGLIRPAGGRIRLGPDSLWDADEDKRLDILRRFGILYQGGALWSSLTLGENIALALESGRRLEPGEIRELVSLKLALVGLAGCEDYYPAELSGGMKKRAGLARALALDPEILFFDEPSSGLDPVNARRMDDLILELRDSLGATFVVVTHELASLLAIGDDSIFLDAQSRSALASGRPRDLLDNTRDPRVRSFLNREPALNPEAT